MSWWGWLTTESGLGRGGGGGPQITRTKRRERELGKEEYGSWVVMRKYIYSPSVTVQVLLVRPQPYHAGSLLSTNSHESDLKLYGARSRHRPIRLAISFGTRSRLFRLHSLPVAGLCPWGYPSVVLPPNQRENKDWGTSVGRPLTDASCANCSGAPSASYTTGITMNFNDTAATLFE